MHLTLPLVLIAFGSVAIVALREGRLLVVALLAQWGGLVLLLLGSMPTARVVWVELAVALVCSALLSLTVWTLHNVKIEELPSPDESHRAGWLLRQEKRSWYGRESGLADQALLWVIALVGGVAGFGLARLYPLGGSEESMLAFHWILLSAALALLVDGARDLVKLGIGLLVLLNAIALLVETMVLATLSDLTLGLLAVCRVALVLIISYLLVVLKGTFLDADLDDIFDARAGITGDEMALVVVGAGGGGTNYEQGSSIRGGLASGQLRSPIPGANCTNYEGTPLEENSAEVEMTPVETEEEDEAPAGG